jgi:glyoxylase-like metal-dependent hydrolase (beta-lactamase superfamily II)
MGRMKNTLLVAALLASSAVAHAETKLTVTPFTASPTGFLVNSTLVVGDKEAILIDAQFSLADAHRLIANILESKKTLTTVYITHSHPDHFFGLAAIKAAFPGAKLVATPGALAEIKKTADAKIKQWGPMYGALVPTKAVLPTALAGTKLTLEGQTLEIKTTQGDSADNTYVWIPSTKTLIAGDIVFAGVHAWTRETNADQRKAWIKSLDDLAALNPTTVIPGHQDPKAKQDASAIKATKDYLLAFDDAVKSSKTPGEVETKMKAKYGTLALDIILKVGAETQFPAPAKK